MTGKRNGWSVGGLAIDDRAPGRRLDPSHPARGDRTGIGVVRVQRDLPRQSSIGVLATTLDFASSESRVVGVDGRYRISDTWVAEAQVAVSHFQPLGGAGRSGPAISLMFDRTGRNWGAFLRSEDISPDFRAPLGFVQRVDTRRLFPFARYTWFPERRGLVSIRAELSGSALWDHARTLQDWESNLEAQFEMKGQTEFEIGVSESMERFGGQQFRKRDVNGRFETAWLRWLELSAEVGRGSEINFFPSEGVRPFLANGTEAQASVVLKPTPPLRLDQTYLFTRLGARAGSGTVAPGAVIVDNHIWRSRASYQFTRRLSVRAIVDYQAVLPDAALIDLERDKQFGVDALVTYLVNPWTAVYVGYTDGYGNREIDPLTGDRVRLTDSAFHSLGRQVFVKTSYLFRF